MLPQRSSLSGLSAPPAVLRLVVICHVVQAHSDAECLLFFQMIWDQWHQLHRLTKGVQVQWNHLTSARVLFFIFASNDY